MNIVKVLFFCQRQNRPRRAQTLQGKVYWAIPCMEVFRILCYALTKFICLGMEW